MTVYTFGANDPIHDLSAFSRDGDAWTGVLGTRQVLAVVTSGVVNLLASSSLRTDSARPRMLKVSGIPGPGAPAERAQRR